MTSTVATALDQLHAIVARERTIRRQIERASAERHEAENRIAAGEAEHREMRSRLHDAQQALATALAAEPYEPEMVQHVPV